MKPLYRQEQRSEKLIWWVIGLSLSCSLILKTLHSWPMPIDYFIRQGIAVCLFLSGLSLRIYAVASLGRFFTTRVAICHEHRLIQTGPYRFIRHPSYTGLIIAFSAAGIAMGDVIAFIVLLFPIICVLSKRIDYEESYLSDHFGQQYKDYCSRTKKLIPFLY